MKRRDLLAFGAAMLCASATTRRALAQAKYPDRPIKLVVPFVPGGVNDAVARLWADRVKAPLGTVFIENQGGGGGSQVLNPIAMSKPLYDPIKDFEPIAILATTSLTIAVTPALPVHTLKELIAYAKANPGQLVYGSAGTGSKTQLAGEMFKSLAGTPDVVHVPYKGSG